MKESRKGLLQFYIIGFIVSIVLTLIPYFLVTNHLFSGDFLVTVIISFAVLQLFVQVYFFLHLGQESKPRWKLWMLLAFVGLILVVVTGSIWIMEHLNYNMSTIQLNDVLKHNEGGF